MVGARRAKYLRCFYCNQGTSTKWDKSISRWECSQCDAINWLDENGDICDPPAAMTDTPSRAPQYAVPLGSSPKSRRDSASDIFCRTCLKNQHLYAASLAQYLPDDPDAPDYKELDSNYHKFKRNLEQRYPQICPKCEPKVLERINRAVYTAKADFLKRRIDQSKENRKIKARSWLDRFDMAGRWAWATGVLLQVLWHISAVYYLALSESAQVEDFHYSHRILQRCQPVFDALPEPGAFARWSVVAGIMSIWWNPRLVETVRGFTKHITGLPKWYTLQATIVGVRLLSGFLLATSQAEKTSAQLAVHIFISIFTLVVDRLAHSSIRVEAANLFGASPARRPRADSNVLVSDKEDTTNMAQLLDEILHTPPKDAGFQQQGTVLPLPDAGFQERNGSSWGASISSRAVEDLSTLRISPNSSSYQPTPPVQYDEQMDWSPTQSRHRAFNSYGTGQQQSQKFGHTPTEPQKGAFWYRVPPAPTNPAQRLFNPPNQPRIRKPALQSEELKTNFQGYDGRTALPETDDAGSATGVTFAQPSLFPQERSNDPRNSLSDMFGKSFGFS